jgi:hypothetical protein
MNCDGVMKEMVEREGGNRFKTIIPLLAVQESEESLKLRHKIQPLLKTRTKYNFPGTEHTDSQTRFATQSH